MVAGDPVADQRAMCIIVLFQEVFVVQCDVDSLLLVPRVSGQQMDNGLGPRILGSEIQGHTGLEEGAQGPGKADASILVPHERRNGDRWRRHVFHTLHDEGLQGRMRCQFQHHIGPVIALDSLHRIREKDPPANIRPPIGTIQTLRLRTRHRRDEGDFGFESTFVKEGECLQRILLDRIHSPGMKSDVARDQPVLEVAPVQFLHHRSKVVFGTADDRVGRRVFAGNLDPDGSVTIKSERNVQSIQQLLQARSVEADGQHSSGPRHALLQGRAMVNQPRRVGKGERARGIGCGHLAGTVAYHAVGIDTPRLEQLHQGALDHEDDGLGELNLVESLLRRLEAGLAQRRACMLPPVPVNGIHNTAEDRMSLIEVAPATGPLRSLPGEHHDQPPFAFVHRSDGGVVFRNGIQRIDQIRLTAYRERRTCGEMGAAAAEIACERVEVHRVLVKQVAQPPRTLDQRLWRTRRERNQVARAWCKRHRPEPGPGRPILAHHAMAVCTTETERVDAHQDRVFGERLASRLHAHGTGVEVDLRIGHLEAI